jgi:heparan-alpha-glucosaminide N-acetyltransferase
MSNPNESADSAEVALVPSKPARLGSLDAYRGLVMFLMMAEVLELRHVAEAAKDSAIWKFLALHQSHVPWAGCTLHDLIQPSFSFLVGVSLPFSITSRAAKGQSRGWMLAHAVWRGIVLVLLGVFLRSMSKSQTNWTFEDTLSQIGFGYLPLFLLGFTKQRWQWVALVALLVGYWGAFALYPLPSADFNYVAVDVPADWPHHSSGLAAHWNKNSNLAWAFDTWFLNLFPRPKPFTHNSGGYATLSFIPTLATMVLGLIAGGWLQRVANPWKKVGWFVATGLVLIALGIAADRSGICPNVKRIWTPTWVLFSGGWCFLFLAAFYAVIDVAGLSAWSFPLRVIGANSIAAYLLAHGSDRFLARSFEIHFGKNIFQFFGATYEPLMAGAIILAIQWLILWWLYRNRIFIRI